MAHIKENDARQTVFMELFYEEAKKEGHDYILEQMTKEEKEDIKKLHEHISSCDDCSNIYNSIKDEIKRDMSEMNGCPGGCEGCNGCF